MRGLGEVLGAGAEAGETDTSAPYLPLAPSTSRRFTGSLGLLSGPASQAPAHIPTGRTSHPEQPFVSGSKLAVGSGAQGRGGGATRPRRHGERPPHQMPRDPHLETEKQGRKGDQEIIYPLTLGVSKLRPREETGLVQGPMASGRQRLGCSPSSLRLLLCPARGHGCARGSEQGASLPWCLESSPTEWAPHSDLEATSPRWQRCFAKKCLPPVGRASLSLSRGEVWGIKWRGTGQEGEGSHQEQFYCGAHEGSQAEGQRHASPEGCRRSLPGWGPRDGGQG